MTNASIEEKPETTKEISVEIVLDNTKEVLETMVEETPVRRWMDIAAPILQSGGKTVAVILALGFVAIPLMISGNPWVAPILATGACIVAISSCF
ncbi:hypothetical protein [Nostoc sp. CALU 1950]|uniref:hypothetical protein n=1 Tax=Nostoc sp. CALU 1950 TaxID=3104321 RepID=UPI003EB80D51